MAENSNISKIRLFYYSIIALPLGFVGIPIYLHAPKFYAAEYGLSLGALGIILFLLRLIDAIQDPFLGYLLDKYQKRLKTILCGTVALMIASFFMLFNPNDQISVILWFSLAVFLSTTSASLMSICVNTLGSKWSKDINTRTRITSWREGFGLIGILIASALPVVLTNKFDAKIGFYYLSIIFALVMLIGFSIFLKWLKTFKAVSFESPKFKLFDIFKDKNTRGLFIVYAFSILASVIPSILVLFYVKDWLKAEDLAGLYLLIYFISGAACMPVWQIISKKYGKWRAWQISIFLAVATFSLAVFVQAGDIYLYGLVCALSGLAVGGDLAIPFSILADKTEKHPKTANQYFATMAFISKFMLAVASIIILPTLEYFGYQPDGESSKQSLQILAYVYTLFPCIIKLVAAFLINKFKD